MQELDLDSPEGSGAMKAVEIRSLNAADLDVEELESRLEMAAAVPNADCWVNVCPINL